MYGHTEHDEPHWTSSNQSRRKGDTTFKQCGWCEHAGCGSYRYGCMLSGNCTLMKEYGNDVKWDTPCKIMHIGKKDIDSLIKSKDYYIKESEERIERLKKERAVLEDLRKTASDRPPLPDARSHDHFNVGDRVAVAIEGKWVGGTVVYGYRHHDGCVSYALDGMEPPEFKKLDNCFDRNKDPEKWKWHQETIDSIGPLANAPGCGTSVPCVMLLSEWEWFADHPDEYRRWLAQCIERTYNGERLDPADLPPPSKGKLGKVKPGWFKAKEVEQ